MKKIIIFSSIYLFLSITCYGQISTEQSYEELRAEALNYFPDKADSTIILMEYALNNFPHDFLNSSTILAQVYMRVDELSRAIEIWRAGIQKGYAYGLDNKIYQQYFKDNTNFEQLIEEEKRLLSTMHMKHEVLLPESYNKNSSYPILFIFHGNSRNILKSKTNWNSPLMSEEFITVFLQSYLPASSEDFRWVPGDDKTRNEFQGIYNKILKEYAVDKQKIVFAGMSAGGWIAIEFIMNNYFPVDALVLNCPVIPTDIDDDMIQSFVSRNRKLAIITGENDFALENQKELVGKITGLNGQAKIKVKKDLGHDFSEDFTEQLDENLKWILEAQSRSRNGIFSNHLVIEDYIQLDGRQVLNDSGSLAIPYSKQGYTLHLPDQEAVATLIMLSGSALDTTRYIDEYEIIKPALDHNIAVLFVSTGKVIEFLFTEEDIDIIDKLVGKALDTHKLSAKPKFLAGMSLGGTMAMRYSEYCLLDKSSHGFCPDAIALCDAPLDMVRLFHEQEQAIKNNFHPAAAGEAQWVSHFLIKHLGGRPDEAMDSYIGYSPFVYKDDKRSKIQLFKDIPIRMYHEPDISWWIENRAKDYNTINSIDLAGFYNYLRQAGSDEAELITTYNKRSGYQDGSSPHTWTIVDNEDLIAWFLSKVE